MRCDVTAQVKDCAYEATSTYRRSTVAHSLPLSTEGSDRLIQEILDAFNRESLTREQASVVLDRIKQLIDLGELIARHSRTVWSDFRG